MMLPQYYLYVNGKNGRWVACAQLTANGVWEKEFRKRKDAEKALSEIEISVNVVLISIVTYYHMTGRWRGYPTAEW